MLREKLNTLTEFNGGYSSLSMVMVGINIYISIMVHQVHEFNCYNIYFNNLHCIIEMLYFELPYKMVQ